MGKIFSINVSEKKGISKMPVESAILAEGLGVIGDAHSGPGIKQVSLLAIESIRKQSDCPKAKKDGLTIGSGDFAENITTEGIELSGLKIGDKLIIADSVELEVSKIGKDCHRYCAIYYKIGGCIMPREGIFAKVIKPGKISLGDSIKVN